MIHVLINRFFMLIYNITSKISWPVHEEWVNWMLKEHIIEVLETGLILKYQLVRLHDVDDIDGPTFAVQYYLESREHYDLYIDEFAPGLTQKVRDRWGDDVLSFRTLMEVIN
jgi:uncharacterized protein DUF4286